MSLHCAVGVMGNPCEKPAPIEIAVASGSAHSFNQPSALAIRCVNGVVTNWNGSGVMARGESVCRMRSPNQTTPGLIDDAAPYWRVAVQRDLVQSFFKIIGDSLQQALDQLAPARFKLQAQDHPGSELVLK